MKSDESEGKIQVLTDINKLIHEPARLMIISLLYVVESADFVWIKGQTGLTDGNLSSHLSKLESAGYVIVEKRFKNKKPNTLLKLSEGGRKAFEEYLNFHKSYYRIIILFNKVSQWNSFITQRITSLCQQLGYLLFIIPEEIYASTLTKKLHQILKEIVQVSLSHLET